MLHRAVPRGIDSTISYLTVSPKWTEEKPYIAGFPLDDIEGFYFTKLEASNSCVLRSLLCGFSLFTMLIK